MDAKFLNQKYMYGGEIMKLGSIIADLQQILPNQKCVDRYLQGLLLTQTPKTVEKEML